MNQELIEQIYSLVKQLDDPGLLRLGNISLVTTWKPCDDDGDVLSDRQICIYDNETRLGGIYDEYGYIYDWGFNSIDKEPLFKSIVEQLQERTQEK